MAIQKRTTPIESPSVIKNSPQSFTEQELNQLKELRTKINKLVGQFGQLYINKIKLEESEKNLKNQILDLENQEADIAKNLSKKYGDGSIDLETGTFTPTE